jgi:hypothetical protein
MRALASLVALCLVAAAGVRPVAAAPGRPCVVEVSRAVATLHARVVDAALPGRADSAQLSRAFAATSQASRPSGPAGAGAPRASGAPDLSAIAVDRPVAPAPPDASPAGRIAGSSQLFGFGWLSTHAARGPPIV